MGIEGEHDQIACSGRIEEKQIGQSGYGGVLRFRIKLEARSSPPGRRFGLRSPCGLLETVAFDLEEEDPGWVRVAPNFARRPLFGGAGTLSPLTPSALLWSPCGLVGKLRFDLEDSGWVRFAAKFARRPPSFFGGGSTPGSPLSPSAFGGFR